MRPEMGMEFDMCEPDVHPDEGTDTRGAAKSQTSTSPQYPLYASLAEYTLSPHRTSPLEPSPEGTAARSSLGKSTSGRVSLPLQPIDESSRPRSSINQSVHGPSSSPLAQERSMSSTSRHIHPFNRTLPHANPMTPIGSSTGLSSSRVERPQRSSTHLHEIQPPSRRLSPHQMLLLTPFGGQLPSGLPLSSLPRAGSSGEGMGMSRGSSGMSRGSSSMGHPAKLPKLGGKGDRTSVGSSTGSRRENTYSPRGSVDLGVGVQTPMMDMGRSAPMPPIDRLPLRVRQSFGNSASVTHHSPLASAPMTTIDSGGSSEGNSSKSGSHSRSERRRNTTFLSREEVNQNKSFQPRLSRRQVELVMADDLGVSRLHDESATASADVGITETARVQLMPATVAMTRSNSLPVLTARELDALIEKDGELGIQRGGHWAWVSREVTVDENGEEVMTTEDAPRQIITPRLPSSDRNFTSFNDPFASVTKQAYIPIATSTDYHYSPTYEARRMSEAPSHVSTAGSSPTARRPSVPVEFLGSRGNSLSIGSRPLHHQSLRLSHGQASIPRASLPSSTSGQTMDIEESQNSPGSPPGSPLSIPSPPSAIPVRPRITRYKSSPARSTGLGLNITLVPFDSATASTSRRGSAVDRNEKDPLNHEGHGTPRRTSTTVMGHWAEVDFVDSVVALPLPPILPSASETIAQISPTTSPRNLSQILSVHPVQPGSPATTHLISSFELFSFKERDRFESVDSALPLMPGGSSSRLSVPPTGAGEAYHSQRFVLTDAGPDTPADQGTEVGGEKEMPRRGSLGMGTFARLKRALAPGGENEGAKKHWSDRRGSWAENWKKDSGL